LIMIKKNKRLKMGFLEKDLLINNFYSEANFCKPKNTVSRFMAFGFLLVIALVASIGILSMLAAPGDSVDIGISVNVLPLPTATISANPNPIPNISSTSLLSWSSTDATSCTASGDWSGAIATSGTQSIGPLSSAKTYAITCSGPGGTSAPATVNVVVTIIPPVFVPSNPIITSFVATPSSVAPGSSSELSWTSSDITSCTASTSFGVTDWDGSTSISLPNGSNSVILPDTPGTYTYTLTCNGVSKSVDINVALPPSIIDFSSDKTSVNPGGGAKLSWQVVDASSCSASTIFGATDWTGVIGLTGEKDVILPNIEGSYVYKLTCQNDFGSASKVVNINVSSAVTPITNPINVPEGGPSPTTFGSPGGIEIIITVSSDEVAVDSLKQISFSWKSLGADKCTASGAPGWSGDKALSGSELLQNPGQIGIYTYVLTCENVSGQKTVGYAKISVIESAKIEGLVNIIERELTSQFRQSQGAVQLLTVPLSDVLDKTGLIQAFSVSSKKSPWQNAVSAMVLLAIAGLIGKGASDFYLLRKNWGLVFNNQNNMPITDAKIELRKTSNNQIIQTILTDHKGRFRFKLADLKNGEYYVDVSKINYSFPSRLFSKKANADKNIYLGKNFKLIKNNGLRLKIPVDPVVNK